MIVTRSHFLRYQEALYQKILSVPYKVGLEVSAVNGSPSSGFSINAFVGDSPRSSVTHSLQALYVKEISNREREKYGLPMEVNGEIYFSPKQLIPLFGTYLLDWNKTKIHFEGRIQVIDKVVYLEQMYDTCIGIQLFLKDSLKGG